MTQPTGERFSFSNLHTLRVDWSLKTPAAKLHFVVTILGELIVGALLIYGAFFVSW